MNFVEEITQGNIIWLEPTQLHFHPGDSIKTKVLWGSAMQKMVPGNPENLTAHVNGPDGKVINAEILDSDSKILVQHKAGRSGLYHLVVENDAGVYDGKYYYQWARLPVPVGHHICDKGIITGQGLEIVPNEFMQYHPGDTFNLQVLLNGNILPGAEVKITYHLYDEPVYPYSQKTNEKGQVDFTFNAKGHWLFLVNYEEKVDNEEYNSVCYSCTYVMPGVI
ncbi:MAG: DUF4198 domain-containing protein [Clostridiales bacterium]|nr:DUF4198 domain-containing protein [Clostridiales bacterium]MCF8022124.1 DUF4198 domain-containing protein [Clostridiales bacterium]